MKLRHFFIFLFLLISCQIIAQSWVGPQNPEFTRNGQRLKSEVDTGSFGYIPFPNRLVFAKKSNLKSTASLPTTFDLRLNNFITSVKNQGSGQFGGNCWAFAQLGSIESRWLELGLGSFDLSEQNMVTCHGFNSGYGAGGNDMIAFAYLGRFSGPLSESADTYNTSIHTCTPNLTPVAFVPDIMFLDGSSRDEIKTYLMQFGALSISLFWDNASYYNGSSRYPYTYCYQGDSTLNHQVVIVGWDDTKRTSGGTGVWIVKNSWGANWGLNGYFYIAYQDTRALSTVSFNPSRFQTNEISKVFMNDKLGPISSAGYKNTIAYALVKYKSPSKIQIHKIGTFASSSNTIISASIFKSFNGQILSDSITSITPQILKNPGFYMFDTKFETDSVFYIKVKYVTPSDINPIPIEKKVYSDATTIYADPEILPKGTQWISGDGIHWDDCGSNASVYIADLCIRAYSGNLLKPVAGFKTNKSSVCVNSNVTFTDLSDHTITSYTWDFGDGANPKNAYTTGPHNVTYSTTGLKNISLIVSGPQGQDTIIKTGYLEVANTLNLVTSVDSVGLELGRSLQIEAYGADSFSWLPTYNISSDTGRIVTVSPTKDTTYTLTGKDGACTATKKIIFKVAPRPVNDDVCNSTELKMGYNGLFTNLMATVQNGEPAPKEGDCNTPLQWCIEGGLQNSVWFNFTPSKTAAYSLISAGMDTQMAIYEADSCAGILKGGAKLIAANDDYYNVAPYPAAINLLSMTANKKYWVQIDGSGGGVSGNFSITIVTGGVGVEQENFSSELKLYPNPANGQFTIEMPGNSMESIRVSIFDLTGRMVYEQTYKDHSGNLIIDPGNLFSGIYFVKVSSESYSKSIKLVVER